VLVFRAKVADSLKQNLYKYVMVLDGSSKTIIEVLEFCAILDNLKQTTL
jgi:hypothetical protein